MAHRLCPVWIGYFLACPIRKMFQNPEKILSPYIRKGMTVLDIGCAMGFFSLPLARMVGAEGKVISSDIQDNMLRSLEKRAEKAGLADRITTRLCHRDSFNLHDFKEQADFALAFAVLHELPDISMFFSEVYEILKSDGRLLIAEPKGHVSEKEFEITVSVGIQKGFKSAGRPRIAYSHAVILEKEI
ncbi:MAG: hypothetical protein BWK80_56915 [Desulfobacteraceae bacterium IS3]|nr:MAG: hypothetical protein BWK80_56915 [Desulfobacteraceae bacterium IS3]